MRGRNLVSRRRQVCVLGAMIATLCVGQSAAEGRAAQGKAQSTNQGTAQSSATGTTRGAMQEIFAQLQVLLPAAIQGELGSPEKADELALAFKRLQGRIDGLPAHGNGLDPGARLFGRALSHDVRRANAFFERGRFENAAFVVQSMVDDCTACHARGPAADSVITKGFLEESALKLLDPLERAGLSVATRQFDDAMKRYEKSFAEPDLVPSTLLGPMIRYLTVAVRVVRDPSRAQDTVARFEAHPNLAKSVREDARHWRKVLGDLKPGDLVGTTIVRAEEATKAAENVGVYPGDARALIEFLIASAQLHDLVARPRMTPADRAQVYELLGRAEYGAAQSVWLSRADLYWETAIRLAPSSPAARRAYERLEKETHLGFTGSGGLRLPDDEEARLKELKELTTGKAEPVS